MKIARMVFWALAVGSAVGLGIVGAALAKGTKNPSPTYRVVSVRAENFSSDDGSKLRCQRTELMIALPGGARKLQDIADEACRVTRFVDDKGASLATPKGALFGLAHIDGRDYLNVCSFKSPSPGAREVSFAARVVVNAVGGQKKIRLPLALKPGSALTSKLVDIRVKQVQHVSFGEVRMMLVLEGRQKPGSAKLSLGDRRVGKLAFLDRAGKPIEYEQFGYKSGGSTDMITTEITYGLHRQVDSVTVAVDVADLAEPVVFDIDVRTGLGL